MKQSSIEDTSPKKQHMTHTHFSTSVNNHNRIQVINEAKPLLTAPLKCKEIWNAIQVADYKKEGILNDAALQVFFEKQSKNLEELLMVKTPEELINLVCEDGDGLLSEDEQILIFSIIKERMQIIADQLCNILEYGMYKDMMKFIRQLETDILHYQNVFRSRTHQKELEAYHENGQQRVENFKITWHDTFERFKEESQHKIQALKEIQRIQIENLETEMNNDKDFLKIKPKAIIRDLQTEEKLFAINERYAEAQKIRNELAHLESSEQVRILQEHIQEQKKKREKLIRQHVKEMNMLLMKNQSAENTLKIQKEQEEAVLLKAIKVHVNDITKYQHLAKRIAEKVGRSRDELRRTKSKARVMNKYLQERKSVAASHSHYRATEDNFYSSNMFTPSQVSLPNLQNSPSLYKNRPKTQLKVTLHTVTRFNIRSSISSQNKPTVEIPDYLCFPTSNKSSGKLLSQKSSKFTIPSITALYDTQLEEINTNE